MLGKHFRLLGGTSVLYSYYMKLPIHNNTSEHHLSVIYTALHEDISSTLKQISPRRFDSPPPFHTGNEAMKCTRQIMKRGRCRSGRWGAALCTAGVCWIAPGISFTASTQLRVPFKAPGRLTLRRAGLQPPQLDSQSEPPVETGRNPQAVATDFAWGIVLLPVSVLGLIIAYLFSGFLSATSQPPPEVPLSESLAALISIEDDYAVRGPGMGLRQRLSRWFHWAEPNRRVDFEIKDLPNSPLKDEHELGRNITSLRLPVFSVSSSLCLL